MLRGIADFAVQGRWQAAIAAALLSIAALMLPPLTYLASGVIALTTLRMGPKEGINVVAAITILFTLVAGLLLGQYLISGLFLLLSWLPVLGAALILGYTRSLAASLLAVGGLGILLVLGTHLVLADPVAWWQQILAPFMERLVQQQNWELDQTQMQTLISGLSGMMTGLFAASLSINVLLGLLIGRAWQAKLFNPGGFADEFCQLRLGKAAALLAIVLMMIEISPLKAGLTVLVDCLPVVLVIFALQGLSVIHAIVKQQQKHKFWLVAVYVLLVVVMPQMVVLLAMIGVLEQWFNFRRHSVK
ncbi:MAG: DUF2232 domain-containing protein [Methylophaga sp.]|nr:MAG: DUF2232 domain-containing protein [Methylophaga sp.]